MFFRIYATDSESSARTGIIKTDRGDIETPVFMPVGTAGTVKGVSSDDLKSKIKADIILANTYHLYLRPSTEVITAAGGLHKFIGWERPILTDSGGYQVFSLSNNRKLNEEGAIFKSHIDGSKHIFTPENIVEIQRSIGSDIMMAFDECTPYPCEYKYAKESMELTHRWLKRGWDKFLKTEPNYDFNQFFFPIVQGSVFKDLRKISAETIEGIGAPGNAIGGLSVGEPHEIMYEMVEIANSVLSPSKPRYLMGVGTPANLLECIGLGIDMFDCVMPTRNGRNGSLFTSEGMINIKNLKWKNDFTPIDSSGATITGSQYSKAYLRHLIVSNEMSGSIIASIHNLEFYSWLMSEARKNIKANNFTTWKKSIINRLSRKL